MTNIIKFTYNSEYAWNVAEKPKPASSFIPKWHRELPSYHGADSLIINNGMSNATAKKCVPMLDAIVSGYIVPLWSDIFIEESGQNNININWKVRAEVFQDHGASSEMVPAPKEYYPMAFKYVSNLTVETPKGYSILVTQPIGHYDSPFLVIPAVIDSDKPTVDLAFPVWIKRGTSGIIEKGTPVVQIIPFKRNNWKAEFDYITFEKFQTRIDKFFNATIKNNYFKNTWSKKDYK